MFVEQVTEKLPQGPWGVERDVADCEGPGRRLGEEVGLYSECDVKIAEGLEEERDVV